MPGPNRVMVSATSGSDAVTVNQIVSGSQKNKDESTATTVGVLLNVIVQVEVSTSVVPHESVTV